MLGCNVAHKREQCRRQDVVPVGEEKPQGRARHIGIAANPHSPSSALPQSKEPWRSGRSVRAMTARFPN
jgi:hypothetical protein